MIRRAAILLWTHWLLGFALIVSPAHAQKTSLRERLVGRGLMFPRRPSCLTEARYGATNRRVYSSSPTTVDFPGRFFDPTD